MWNNFFFLLWDIYSKMVHNIFIQYVPKQTGQSNNVTLNQFDKTPLCLALIVHLELSFKNHNFVFHSCWYLNIFLNFRQNRNRTQVYFNKNIWGEGEAGHINFKWINILLLIKTSIFHSESLGNKDTSAPYEDQFCGERDHQYEGIVSTTAGSFLFSISVDKNDLTHTILRKNTEVLSEIIAAIHKIKKNKLIVNFFFFRSHWTVLNH